MRRRGFIRFVAAGCMLACGVAYGQEQVHRGRLDHIERAVGPVRHLLPAFKKARPASRCASSRSAPARRSTSRGAATPTCVFVHDQAAEEKFVAEGYGVKRFPVMYNDFVLVGPKSDPAKVAAARTSSPRCAKIAAAQCAVRLARRQQRHARGGAALLEDAPASTSRRQGRGVQGMRLRHGPGAQHRAPSMNAYVLADRGTWLSFKNRGDLAILVEGDKRLFNQYGVMVVNPAKHPHVKKALGAAVRRLGDLAGGAGGDRRVQDRRRAAVLPERYALNTIRPQLLTS